jgi:hypothetical protein
MTKETKTVATTNFTINQKFNFLDSLTTMVVNNTTPSLIVTGEGGLGKTHSVTSTIQDNSLEDKDYLFIKGYSTARGLYNTLYDNNGKLIIFDDCDSVLDDRVAINILKSALDSYETRTITWSARMNKADVYPQSFNFTGRIIFISNKDKAKIDGAILSRSLTVDLSMTPDEKIQRMEYILPNILPEYKLDVKKDALKFLSDNKESDNLNLRTLIMVSKIRHSYEDSWQDLANYMINS